MELKPCPFCGDKAMLYGSIDKNSVSPLPDFVSWVQCMNCGVKTNEYKADILMKAREMAISAWNRRASDEKENVC